MLLPDGPRELDRLVLEISLKPFRQHVRESYERVWDSAVAPWERLLGTKTDLSILLWASDGSEMVEWSGDLNHRFSWASGIGFNNADFDPYSHPVSPLMRAVPYVEKPLEWSYGDLQQLIATGKAYLERRFGASVSFGATFDPGPEFATSSFKYSRHPELVGWDRESPNGISMLDVTRRLEADDRSLAAFPDGVEEGTSFGEFLGRQFESYAGDLGFDYLWLSNGIGFSAHPWTQFGVAFNGQEFGTDRSSRLEETRRFWRDLRAHTRLPLGARGTNFSQGIDIAVDLSPVRDIYEGAGLQTTVPNSPWGALNRDIAIEVVGFLTRLVRPPQGRILQRFYANDPWFWQNPWREQYAREPYDIFLPAGLSVLRNGGSVASTTDFMVLTVDDERGEIDPRIGQEISGHLLRAREAAPDSAAPVVLVYPLDRYADELDTVSMAPGTSFFEDWYLSSAVASGLPLGGVVDARDLAEEDVRSSLSQSILIVPTSAAAGPTAEYIIEAVRAGAKVLMYGSLVNANHVICDALNIEIISPAHGELHFEGSMVKFTHNQALSGGGIAEVASRSGDPHQLRVTLGHDSRLYGTSCDVGLGKIAWVRGSLPFEYEAAERKENRLDDGREYGALLVDMLGTLGLVVSHERRHRESPAPVIALHSHTNAIWFDAHAADTTVTTKLRLPEGAPLLMQHDAWFDGSTSHYTLAKSVHAEIRCFVSSGLPGVISCRETSPFPVGAKRSLEIAGLNKAFLSVRVPPGVDRVEYSITEGRAFNAPVPRRTEQAVGGFVHFPEATGVLTITW